MADCHFCGRESSLISKSLNLCTRCITKHFETVLPRIKKNHALSREKFHLPPEPPRSASGITCDSCINRCQMEEGERGYCGLRRNKDGKLLAPTIQAGNLSWYHDPLPTNCVGDWICPAGTDAGYPEFSYSKGPETGYKNLAVFYHGCTFNCLFCQNWHFKEHLTSTENFTASELAQAVDSKTACICHFGGDPTPQLSHAIKASHIAIEQNSERILRICWETNGSMHPRLVKKIVDLSLPSGGCIKFDLKCFNEKLHIALCGVSNRLTLKNFAFISSQIRHRKVPPLLIASTLLIPGYIDEDEVFKIARFISSLNPDIPYSLLGFHPSFFMTDLPRTSRSHAENCLQAAHDAGLKSVTSTCWETSIDTINDSYKSSS